MSSRSRYANAAPVLVVYYGSDQRCELQNLTDALSSTAVTTATVTAVITDADGNAVSGIANPLTLSHVASGTYRGIIPDTASLTVGQRVTVEATADDGANRKALFRATVEVQYG